MSIHRSTTEVVHASIAWDIEIAPRTGYRIVIRHIALDGVEINGAELSSGVLAELRDVVEASPEYDPSYIGQLVRDLRWEAEQDARADSARDNNAA